MPKAAPRLALWTFYVVLVLEILFMISPAALYFYSAYGPALNLLHASPWTSWLTTFFLPHFSQTSSLALRAQKPLGEILILVGAVGFLVGFLQIYVAKLRRSGAVLGGLYRWVRHPQYTALAILGLGTLLMWPRFLALVMYTTMLCLYAWLARREEAICVERFGDSYARYLSTTGRFVPRFGRRHTGGEPTPPRPHRPRPLRALGALAIALALGFVLRDYALLHVSGVYLDRTAVLSPAILATDELRAAHAVALTAEGVRDRLRPDEPVLVYVLPETWFLADLPAERWEGQDGHSTPADFDRSRLKVLFTRPRTHSVSPRGVDIVRSAYGREPVALVHVDTTAGEVLAADTPPGHVLWGDIPTPMF